MPRAGAITFGDLDSKLDVLRVVCRKCDRRGQYHVARLIEEHGRDGRLVDFKEEITADCPRARTTVSVSMIFAVRAFRIS